MTRLTRYLSRAMQPHFLDELFGGLFGGGGGGGGSDSMEWYKSFLEDQIAKQELSAERETERSKTQSDVRRNELADRTGYEGLVNTGPGVLRTDETLAAQMALLDPTDPMRATYEKEQLDEAAKQAQATRIVTGEEYEAQDAFKEIADRIGKAEDLDALLAEVDTLTGKYSWYDTSTVRTEIEAERARRKKAAEDFGGQGTSSTTSEGGG